MEEPLIKVGIIDRISEISVTFNGLFRVEQSRLSLKGKCRIKADVDGFMVITDEFGNAARYVSGSISFIPEEVATFSLQDVKIGISFHWEQLETQTFHGDLHLVLRDNGTMAVINRISLEDYLVSVISSEMKAGAPIEFLKAHAIASRSWLAAMLVRSIGDGSSRFVHEIVTEEAILRWYEREDHDFYDVCADDHCQRYQGVTKVVSVNAVRAVKETTGLFLISGNEICDARFSKACGGLTERYENVWEEKHVPYLVELSDSVVPLPPIHSEREAEAWVRSNPDVFCNVADLDALRNILPDFDRDTDFFRWRVVYERRELEEILRKKAGIDFGDLVALEPLERGLSGRIAKLKIKGSQRTIIVGKELEIRRWLSPSHLLSSAFIVETETGRDGLPARFIFSGAGWGHGVGMCQIGAAMMAEKSFHFEEILKHYYPGTKIERKY